jgi:hypothetical protein
MPLSRYGKIESWNTNLTVGSSGGLGVITNYGARNDHNRRECDCDKNVRRPELNASPFERHRCTGDREDTANSNALARA